MSRIGKIPVPLSKDVSVSIDDKNNVKVTGPLGTLMQSVDKSVSIKQENDTLVFSVNDLNDKRQTAMHGLYRAILSNMVTGVTRGYSKKLEIVGVGYKVAQISEGVLDLDLGFSHKVYFVIPSSIKAKVEIEKGKNPIVTFEGIDKQLVGQVAAKMKSLRKVEPYKGKGIRYVGEVIKLKEGKKVSK